MEIETFLTGILVETQSLECIKRDALTLLLQMERESTHGKRLVITEGGNYFLTDTQFNSINDHLKPVSEGGLREYCPNKIPAIKLLREFTGMGLRDAKLACENKVNFPNANTLRCR